MDNVTLPLGPSDMTLLFAYAPGEAGISAEDVRAPLRTVDTWLETVQAAGDASESFELVALETLRRLGHPSIR
jgi:hypothetical protein